MTTQRAEAYARVMKHLRDVGPAKLLPAEQDLIRDAADALLFGEGEWTPMFEVLDLIAALVDSDRWTRASAMDLAADVAACGDMEMRRILLTSA